MIIKNLSLIAKEAKHQSMEILPIDIDTLDIARLNDIYQARAIYIEESFRDAISLHNTYVNNIAIASVIPPSSGLPTGCHFRVTRRSISNVLSLSPQREWGKVMVFNNLNGGSKRGFSTLVLEKVQLVILVLPYLSVSGQLVLVLYCLGLSIFLRFGFGSKGSGLSFQSLKTIFHYQTIIPLYLYDYFQFGAYPLSLDGPYPYPSLEIAMNTRKHPFQKRLSKR